MDFSTFKYPNLAKCGDRMQMDNGYSNEGALIAIDATLDLYWTEDILKSAEAELGTFTDEQIEIICCGEEVSEDGVTSVFQNLDETIQVRITQVHSDLLHFIFDSI